MYTGVYEIKLKTGFFKTELYNLSVYNERITLESKEKCEVQSKVFHDKDIYFICIVKKNTGIFEIEINARQGTFIGVLSCPGLEKLFYILKSEFNSKVII